MSATFIGIDLAWRTNRKSTGAAVFRGDRFGAQLEVISTLRSTEAVLDFVRANTTENTVVAIDAPLIIVNQTGQRLCETAVGKRYGKHDASCHTSNLKLYENASSVALTTSLLLADGFVHVGSNNEKSAGRLVAEVYPHAAMVALFGLEKIIKYKKGPVGRREGLAVVRDHLRQLATAEPALLPSRLLDVFFATDLNVLAGRALKNYEDILDAVFCAYLGFYFWYWGDERNELFGDVRSGYILNPRLMAN